MQQNKQDIKVDKFFLGNRFEGKASEPQPINTKVWREIRSEQVSEQVPYPYMMSRWSEFIELAKKLVRHALIQRSHAYSDFRQHMPDILAFGSKLPKALQHSRQVLRSDQNYDPELLQRIEFEQKGYRPPLSIAPQHLAEKLLEGFDQLLPTAFAANQSKFNPQLYQRDLFAGDELFRVPQNLQLNPISLKPYAAKSLSGLEQVVSTALAPVEFSAPAPAQATPAAATTTTTTTTSSSLAMDAAATSLLDGEDMLAKVFPVQRMQAEQVSLDRLSEHAAKTEAGSSGSSSSSSSSSSTSESQHPLAQGNEVAEVDLLLAKLLNPSPNYRTIWLKGWNLAIKGETLGLFAATVSALLEIEPSGFDVVVKYHRAFLQLQLAAAHSEPFSCFLLAWLYKRNFGSVNLRVCFDIHKAYLQRAANQGLDLALIEYAFVIQQESAANVETANNYLFLAARQMHPVAVRESVRIVCEQYAPDQFDFNDYNLGWLLLYIYHVLQPKDITIFCPVGIMLLNGQGVAADKWAAWQIFQVLAPVSLDACYMLGLIYFKADGTGAIDYEKSRYYFEITAPHDLFDSHALLGFLYESGQGGPMDKEKALKHYHAGLWNWQNKGNQLREYCAERLVHLLLEKLQAAQNKSDSYQVERLRSDIFKVLRLCINDFAESKDAWQKRLDEFKTVKKLTDLSYFKG